MGSHYLLVFILCLMLLNRWFVTKTFQISVNLDLSKCLRIGLSQYEILDALCNIFFPHFVIQFVLCSNILTYFGHTLQPKPSFFVTFDIIIRYIFPENFIEIRRVVWKIWIFSSSVLTIFTSFYDFWIFPCCK